jgi:hypothetical protein
MNASTLVHKVCNFCHLEQLIYLLFLNLARDMGMISLLWPAAVNKPCSDTRWIA